MTAAYYMLLHFQKLLKGKPHVCTFGYMPFCIRVFVNNSNALSMKMRREKNSFQGHVSYDELKKKLDDFHVGIPCW